MGSDVVRLPATVEGCTAQPPARKLLGDLAIGDDPSGRVAHRRKPVKRSDRLHRGHRLLLVCQGHRRNEPKDAYYGVPAQVPKLGGPAPQSQACSQHAPDLACLSEPTQVALTPSLTVQP
jgi:hypothetical protein